jgi:ATP/maltotriose-dependent transcriptional regulator MalT
MPLKDIIGKSFLPLFTEESQIIAMDVFQRTLNGESPEYELTFTNGNICQFKNEPLIDKDGDIVGLFGIARDITSRKKAEEALRKAHDELSRKVKERTKELEIKRNSLAEVNTALEILLNKREEDKSGLENDVLLNVKEMILPYIEKIKKTDLDERQETLLSIIETNIDEIISPFSRGLSLHFLALTPTEIQIANLIKIGKSSKQIAEILKKSPRTVDTHRKNIREKIGLKKKRANLRSRLLSLQ